MQANYDVLGVKRTATDAEVRSAYRKLALKHHPDKPGGDEELFKTLTTAYEAVMLNRGKSVNFFELWANMDDEELKTTEEAMRKACLNGNASAVQTLLEAGANIGSTDGMGLTALKYACIGGSDLCVELLLSHGAEIDQTSVAGVTALMEASTMGQESSISLLLEHGAAVDHRNNHGQTALMFACAHGREGCAKLLCEHGADKAAVDADGRNPSDFARKRDFSRLAAWLTPSFLRSPETKRRDSSLRGGSAFAGLAASRESSLHGGSAFVGLSISRESSKHGGNVFAKSRESSKHGGNVFANGGSPTPGSRNTSQHGGSAFAGPRNMSSSALAALFGGSPQRSPPRSRDASQRGGSAFASMFTVRTGVDAAPSRDKKYAAPSRDTSPVHEKK